MLGQPAYADTPALDSIVRRLNFELTELEEEVQNLSIEAPTPYLTPLPSAFTPNVLPHNTPATAFHTYGRDQGREEAQGAFAALEEGDWDSMGSLQLQLVSSSGTSRTWNGAQGGAYWSSKPMLEQSLASARRVKGGCMAASDQWELLASLVEARTGAAKYLYDMRTSMADEIIDAANGLFPSSTCSIAFSKAALGHLATNQDYADLLQQKVSAALPLSAIASARTYYPSARAGMLMPVIPPVLTFGQQLMQSQLAEESELLSAEYDLIVKQGLSNRTALTKCERELSRLQDELQRLKQPQPVQQQSASTAMPASPASKPAAAKGLIEEIEAGGVSEGEGKTKPATTVPSAQSATAAASSAADVASAEAAVQQQEQQLAQLTAEAETLRKKRRDTVQSRMQTARDMEQLINGGAAGVASTERVQAFTHPAFARLITTHDAIILKLFAALDVAYGIADPLTQARFRDLKQGQGIGVAAEESVREYAARVQLHSDSSLRVEPGMTVAQFFAGLRDSEIANQAKLMLQGDTTQALTLAGAAEKVEVIIFNQMRDLQCRAQNGDAAAAAELARRAAAAVKKGKLVPADPKPPKPAFHADPEHPDALCKLHPKGKHTNAQCFASKKQKEAAAAAGIRGATVMTAAVIDPFMQQQQLMQQQLQQLTQTTQHLALAIRGAASSAPSAQGKKCNICGFGGGHPTGFCYYAHPDKAPSWRPGDRAPPELVRSWATRRHQLGLPPLHHPAMPRPGAVAALGHVHPLPLLGAAGVPAAAHMHDQPYVALTAVAHLTPALAAQLHRCHVVAAMPHTFLQYPPAQRTAIEPFGASPALSGRVSYSHRVPPLPPPRFLNRSVVLDAGADNPFESTGGEGEGERDSEVLLGRDDLRRMDLQFTELGTNHAKPASEPSNAAAAEGADSEGAEGQSADREEIVWEPAGGGMRRHSYNTRGQAASSAGSGAQQGAVASAVAVGGEGEGWLPGDLVPCLDTFINFSEEMGACLELPDGRRQRPSKFVIDSGATHGVANFDYCRDIGLHYRNAELGITLANNEPGDVVGITDPVTLVFARRTEFEIRVKVQFLVMRGVGALYDLLLGKNVLMKLGAHVDYALGAFVYRPVPGNLSVSHSIPVRSAIHLSEADPTTCVNLLTQHIIATSRASRAATYPALLDCSIVPYTDDLLVSGRVEIVQQPQLGAGFIQQRGSGDLVCDSRMINQVQQGNSQTTAAVGVQDDVIPLSPSNANVSAVEHPPAVSVRQVVGISHSAGQEDADALHSFRPSAFRNI